MAIDCNALNSPADQSLTEDKLKVQLGGAVCESPSQPQTLSQSKEEGTYKVRQG